MIKNTNIILEINGDYWHANPSIYESEDLLNFAWGRKKAKEIWSKDEIKRLLAEKHNYKVIYLWEFEIIKTKDEELIDLINEKLKIKY